MGIVISPMNCADMRKPADWMRPIDDRILEFLSSEGPNLPTNISDSIDSSRKYTGERCRKLAENGLVENLGSGLYRITELGEQYLSGEAGPDELDETS